MDVNLLNRIINNIDPSKDAIVPWKDGPVLQRLSVQQHGPFIKHYVCAALFGVDLPEDILRASGVGDSKALLKQYILTRERLDIMNLTKQQITRLSRSASGTDDSRLKSVFLSYDAGPKVSEFASTYQEVITPASIIDRAPRNMNPPNMLSFVRSPSTFSPELLRDLGMDSIITSLKFNGHIGSKYTFTINTRINGYNEKTIEYNSTFQPITPEAESCENPKKNKYISEHFQTEAQLGKIQFLALLKELGDTLLVLWLKQLVSEGKQMLTSNKTAITTNDTVVWLRSLVNGVSCIYTDEKGTLSTFYPVNLSEEKIKEANYFLRDQLFKNLRATNDSVVKSISDCLHGLAKGGMFADLNIPDAREASARFALIRVIKSIYIVVKDKARSILQTLRGIKHNMELPVPTENTKTMTEYRSWIDAHTMKTPFIVSAKSIRFTRSFVGFLPKLPSLGLNLGFIDVLCRQEPPSEETMKDILAYNGGPSGFPLIPAEAANMRNVVGGSLRGGGSGAMKHDEFRTILSLNIDIPGFLTSFLMNTIPEIFYMGYAYDMAFGEKNPHQVYSTLLNVGRNNCFSHLLSLNSDFVMDVDYSLLPANRACANIQDMLTKRVCLTVLIASTYGDRRLGTLFDVMGQEINWFLEWAVRSREIFNNDFIRRLRTRYPAPDTRPTLHWDAVSMYQILYDNEVSLCTLNQRDRSFDYAGLMEPAMNVMKRVAMNMKTVEYPAVQMEEAGPNLAVRAANPVAMYLKTGLRANSMPRRYTTKFGTPERKSASSSTRRGRSSSVRRGRSSSVRKPATLRGQTHRRRRSASRSRSRSTSLGRVNL